MFYLLFILFILIVIDISMEIRILILYCIFQSLQSLNELHNTPNFAFNTELEAAFGAAVKTMGPRYLLIF